MLKIPGIGILDVMFSFSQQSPFAGEDEEDLFDSICRDKVHYPKWISQPAEDCLSQVGTVYRKSRKNDTNSRLNFLTVVPYHPYAYFLCCSLCTSGNDKENLLNELELLNLVLIMFFHSHGHNV